MAKKVLKGYITPNILSKNEKAPKTATDSMQSNIAYKIDSQAFNFKKFLKPTCRNAKARI